MPADDHNDTFNHLTAQDSFTDPGGVEHTGAIGGSASLAVENTDGTTLLSTDTIHADTGLAFSDDGDGTATLAVDTATALTWTADQTFNTPAVVHRHAVDDGMVSRVIENTGTGDADTAITYGCGGTGEVQVRFESDQTDVYDMLTGDAWGNDLVFRSAGSTQTRIWFSQAGFIDLEHGGLAVGGTQVVGDQQPAITDLDDNTGGTTNGVLATISGAGEDADLNNNFAELNTKLNSILAALRAHGLIAQ